MNDDVNLNKIILEGSEQCERRKGGELQQNKGWN